MTPAYREMYRVLKPGKFCVTFYRWNKADVFLQAFRTAGFRVDIWAAQQFSLGRLQHFNLAWAWRRTFLLPGTSTSTSVVGSSSHT